MLWRKNKKQKCEPEVTGAIVTLSHQKQASFMKWPLREKISVTKGWPSSDKGTAFKAEGTVSTSALRTELRTF